MRVVQANTQEDTLFRIEAFIDDAKLPRVLHALTGLVIGQPNIQPVANAANKGGKVVAQVANGDIVEILRQELKSKGIRAVIAADLKSFAEAHGRKTYTSLLDKAIEAGVLKKDPKTSGKKTIYKVVGAR